MNIIDFLFYKAGTLKKKLYIFAYKPLSLNSLIEKDICISSDRVDCFSLSSNIIRILNTEEGRYYFREAPKHLEYESFVDTLIADFFSVAVKGAKDSNFKQSYPIRVVYSKDEVSRFAKKINSAKKGKEFYKEIGKINYYMKKSNFSLWQGRISLLPEFVSKIGVLYDDTETDLYAFFISYINTSISSYKFHSFVKKNDYETFNISRAVATYLIAKLLNLESLITKTSIARVTIDGREFVGALSLAANGVRALDTEATATCKLQCSLYNLKVLDAICYQKDHFANNYNVELCNDKAVGVVAFDNDAPWTFLPVFSTHFTSVRNGSPIIDKHGKINLPHLSNELANVICSIRYRNIRKTIYPYLNVLQRLALYYRFYSIRKAIKYTAKNNPSFLVSEDLWDENLLKDDDCSIYGLTYLGQYTQRFEIDQAYLNDKH